MGTEERPFWGARSSARRDPHVSPATSNTTQTRPCQMRPKAMETTLTTEVLPRAFYDRSPEVVARALLGKVLVHRYDEEKLSGRIIEVEAYLGLDDPASHAAVGRTERNAVLFGPPGFAYVYFVYGMHFCLNVSCLPEGQPGGVLFRALAPLHGVDTMRRLRGLPVAAKAQQLTGGPGRLCQALGITRANTNGADVTSSRSRLHIVSDGCSPATAEATPRIGIRKATDKLLRFVLSPEQGVERERK